MSSGKGENEHDHEEKFHQDSSVSFAQSGGKSLNQM
jgi:hypothetical protein